MADKQEEFFESKLSDVLRDNLEILQSSIESSVPSGGTAGIFDDEDSFRIAENALEVNMHSMNSSTSGAVPRIFISHSHVDNRFCSRLVQDLRIRFRDEQCVWWDDGLHGGDKWWSEIIEQLRMRENFIVVLSPEAMSSDMVEDELNIAVNRRMKIIPLLYRDCTMREDLKTRHYISFLPPISYSTAFDQLLTALEFSKYDRINRNNQKIQYPTMLSVQDMIHLIEDAFHKHQWRNILRKINVLVERVPNSVTAELYRIQGIALSELGYKLLALNVLDTALALASDDILYLTLLEDYASILTALERWVDLERIVYEALEVSPNNTSWLMKQKFVYEQLG